MVDLSLKEIKQELKSLDRNELEALITDLAKQSRLNKRSIAVKLASRLDPSMVLDSFKDELDKLFLQSPLSNYYTAKKSLQSIRRKSNQNLSLVKDKTQQLELLLYFCEKTKEGGYLGFRYAVINNIYQMQYKKALKLIDALHEDIAYDFEERMTELAPQTLGIR